MTARPTYEPEPGDTLADLAGHLARERDWLDAEVERLRAELADVAVNLLYARVCAAAASTQRPRLMTRADCAQIVHATGPLRLLDTMTDVAGPRARLGPHGPGCDANGDYNISLPRRGVNGGKPPPGVRNRDCVIDGHEDPDWSGMCIHCSVDLTDHEDEADTAAP